MVKVFADRRELKIKKGSPETDPASSRQNPPAYFSDVKEGHKTSKRRSPFWGKEVSDVAEKKTHKLGPNGSS